MMTLTKIAAGGVVLALATAAHAQGTSGNSLADTLKKFRGNEAVSEVVSALTEDIPMTTAPAAYVLGVSGEQVPRYTTFREFAVGVVRGFDNEGKFTNSISAEIAPALALRVLTLEDQTSFGWRALARTTFSLVSVPGGNDKPASTAYGLQSVLYSREMDQALDAAGSPACGAVQKAAIDSWRNPPRDAQGLPLPAPITPEQKKAIEDCQTMIDGILNRWNQTTVIVGFGQAFRSPDNDISGLKKANRVGWLTGSWGFAMGSAPRTNEHMGGLLTLHARYERDTLAKTPGAATPQSNEDVDLFGAGLRLGKARFNGLLEHSQRKSRIAGLADETRRRTLIGAEYRLREDLYVGFAVGAESGRRDGKNNNLSLANLKWGFGGKSLFGN